MARQAIPVFFWILGITASVTAQFEDYRRPMPPARPQGAPSINDVMNAAPPVYKYQISPQAGPWLICVQTFKGIHSQKLAEELAEVLMRDFKIPAYLYDSGYKQRQAELARVEQMRAQYRAIYEQMEKEGLRTPDGMRRWRVPEVKIEDEFAVLVGKPNRTLKDMEAARDYLDDIRKIKDLPKKFKWTVWIQPDKDSREVRPTEAFINPFITAMVVHNPTMPLMKEQDDPAKADKFLKELNADEEFSVLKCRKEYTLVVKLYQGQMSLQNGTGPMVPNRMNMTRKEGDPYLNACAMQAHATAEWLRKMMKVDAYVMHHCAYSIVTIGQYDKPDDPQLLANQKTFANLQLHDKAQGRILETFNAQPLPMRIPK